MKKLDIESITMNAYLDGVRKERERISNILGYVISKNTTGDWNDEAIEAKKLLQDMTELSSYLIRKIRESK